MAACSAAVSGGRFDDPGKTGFGRALFEQSMGKRKGEETVMSEPIHISHVRIVQDARPIRRAFIEQFPEPTRYGIHSGIAAFYGVTPAEDVPSTLDHMVAAVGG